MDKLPNYSEPIDFKPCQRHNLYQQHLGEELIIYCSEQEMGFSFNNSSKAIWELCDGNHTIDEIVTILSFRFGCSGELFNQDIRNAVSQFQQLGLLTTQ